MLTQIINGRIFTPQGWLNEGSVLMRDGKILEVTNCDLALIGARLIDAKGMYIVPGFVCMPVDELRQTLGERLRAARRGLAGWGFSGSVGHGRTGGTQRAVKNKAVIVLRRATRTGRNPKKARPPWRNVPF